MDGVAKFAERPATLARTAGAFKLIVGKMR